MILDSVENLNKTYAALNSFLKSDESNIRIDAITKKSPEPYLEFLPYLEFIKTEGLISV